MKAYKGFDKDLKCRDFQYEVGKEYEEEDAKLCASGFHACEHPLNVFSYYPPSGSRFAEVDLDATDEREKDTLNTKRVGKKITIKAELSLQGLVRAAVDFVFIQSDKEKKPKHATGDQGAASATGVQGAASATGYQGAASATGDRGIAIACGIDGMAKAALGNWIVISEWLVVEREYRRVSVKSALVDGKKIKADTWYCLEGGKFKAV